MYKTKLHKSFFKDDKTFHTLEKYHILKNSISQEEQNLLKQTNSGYSHAKSVVKELIEDFEKEETQSRNLAIKGNRVKSFSFLQFIEENYGLDILDIETTTLFKEKFDLMSSSFQFISEIKNLTDYFHYKFNENFDRMPHHPVSTSLSPDQEILMIYKYFQVVCSKHSALLESIDLQGYSHLLYVNSLKVDLEKDILNVISQHNFV
ncbi:hypothetical protein PGT21_023029 [Puccinia graminis f. sp. tritici]|nr:hypothetical protein PGT21_023029 [Puccinia graminis f. sp. tritici]KAA1125414.1 hypothetical protein PGTUg99_050023 [Puccinia graminis f. sp. tritici]